MIALPIYLFLLTATGTASGSQTGGKSVIVSADTFGLPENYQLALNYWFC